MNALEDESPESDAKADITPSNSSSQSVIIFLTRFQTPVPTGWYEKGQVMPACANGCLQERSPELRKPQSFMMVSAILPDLCPGEMSYCYGNKLEKVIHIKSCQRIFAHKTCRNARNPLIFVSQQEPPCFIFIPSWFLVSFPWVHHYISHFDSSDRQALGSTPFSSSRTIFI